MAWPARCTTRGWRIVNGVAATQATMMTAIDTANSQNPSQLWSVRPA